MAGNGDKNFFDFDFVVNVNQCKAVNAGLGVTSSKQAVPKVSAELNSSEPLLVGLTYRYRPILNIGRYLPISAETDISVLVALSMPIYWPICHIGEKPHIGCYQTEYKG